MKGKTWGLEIAADWRATNHWRIKAAYAWWRTKLELDNPDYLTSLWVPAEESYSRWQGSLQSNLNVTDEIELDVCFRYVERLPETRIVWFNSNSGIGAYAALDVSLAWDYSDRLKISLVGRNLLDPEHPEYSSFDDPAFEVERDFYLKMDWLF